MECFIKMRSFDLQEKRVEAYRVRCHPLSAFPNSGPLYVSRLG